jgi:serine/threonine-protein kinase
MLYELVTGAPPFTGDSPVAVAYQHVREDPRLPSSINPAIPPELDAILLKAMSKNPANRYQSAADMRNDLLRALAGQRVEATPVMNDADKTTVLGATPGYGGEWDDEDDAARRRRRNRVIAAVVAALVLIGGVVAIALALNSGGDDDPPPVTQVTVPDLVGRPQAEAETAITDAGLVVGDVTTQVTDDEAAVGDVLESNPATGAEVDEGTAVALVVGAAPDSIAVPPVVNLDVEDARTALTNAGLRGSVSTEQVDSLEPEGTVVAVDPEQGSQVPPDTDVTLSVSDGDAEVRSVVGQEQGAATQALRDDGFTNVTAEPVESEEPPGTVVAQDPAGGNQATADAPITLQVSSGPAEPSLVPIPDVVDDQRAAAEAELRAAGFTVTVTEVPAGDPADVGVVLSQNPTGQAAPGAAITLTVGVAPTGGGTPPDDDPED